MSLVSMNTRDYLKMVKAKKAPKYRNVKTEVDGYKFDSKIEAARYSFLKRLHSVALITHLSVKPRFIFEGLKTESNRDYTYIADFSYRNASGALIVEDVKGFKTPEYKIKKALLKERFNIAIKEVTKFNQEIG